MTVTKKENECLELEEYISKVGECGAFQIRTQFIFLIFTIPLTCQIFVPYFVLHDPPWVCVKNSSVCKFKDIIYPQDNERFMKKCQYPRDQWQFTKPNKYSLVTQFDLVCANQNAALLASSILFIGWSIGGLVFSYVADRIGRKKTLYITTTVLSLSAIGSVVFEHPHIFIASRFVIGLCLGGCGIVVFVMSAEIVGAKWRAVSCTMIWFYFVMAMVYLTAFSFVFQDWRWTELSISFPIIIIVFTWKLFPESIRWLRVKGRMKEAEDILKSIAEINNREVPKARLRAETTVSGNANYFNMFHPWQMCLQSTLQGLAWFSTGLTYFGLSLSSQDLSGKFYSDFILTSVVEIPGNIAVIICCNQFGRKRTVIFHMYVASAACVALVCIPLENTNSPFACYVRLAIGMIGKYGVTCQFNSLYIWSAELHPTVLRTQGVGLMVCFSRLAGSLVPLMITHLKYFSSFLPFILMGSINAFSATCCFCLHETKHRATPDTLEENLIYLGVDQRKKKAPIS